MPPSPTPTARPSPSGRSQRARHFACVLLAGIALAGCARTPKVAAPAAPVGVDPAVAMAEAETAYAARDWARAEASYLAAARASPRDPEPWFRLGNVYFRRGSHDLAARAYEETLRVSPDHAKAWHNLGVVRLHQADTSFARVLGSAAGDPELAASAQALRAIVGEAIAPGDQPAP